MILKTYNVLILGTHNSARSIMAEALFNTTGDGVFKAYSAGSSPAGVVNRFGVEEIRNTGYPIKNLRSKSWNEFLLPRSPTMHFVITVCDELVSQPLPVFRGNPMKAHWGFEDPTAIGGSFEEKKEAFKKAFQQIRNRVDLFTALPLAHLDQVALDQGMAKWQQPFDLSSVPVSHNLNP